jgi:hypothetical protein
MSDDCFDKLRMCFVFSLTMVIECKIEAIEPHMAQRVLDSSFETRRKLFVRRSSVRYDASEIIVW